MTLVLHLLRDDSGQTIAEYGIIAAVLGLMMLIGIGALQSNAGSVLGTSSGGWVNLALNPP